MNLVELMVMKDDIRPVLEGGEVKDYKVVYTDDYLAQILFYGKKYATL